MIKLAVVNDNSEIKLLLERISKKKWYQTCEKSIKEKIENINNSDILNILSTLQDNLNKKEIVKVEDITESKDFLIFNLKWRYLNNNQIETKETVLSKFADNEMGKAIILVKGKEKIEWIVLESNFEAINMKYPSFSAAKTIFLPQKLEKWLKTTLKLEKVTINKFIDLGKYRPYSEFSPMEKALFVVIVASDNLEEKINSEFVDIKISKINELIENSGDGAVSLILARLKAKNVI